MLTSQKNYRRKIFPSRGLELKVISLELSIHLYLRFENMIILNCYPGEVQIVFTYTTLMHFEFSNNCLTGVFLFGKHSLKVSRILYNLMSYILYNFVKCIKLTTKVRCLNRKMNTLLTLINLFLQNHVLVQIPIHLLA